MSNAGASLATCYGPVSTQMMAKAENIRLLILDVDGVLSDGLIYMGNHGEELKAFTSAMATEFAARSPRVSRWLSSPGGKLTGRRPL